MKWLQKRREAAASKKLSHQLFELYGAKRSPLLTAFIKLIETDRGATDPKDQRIAALPWIS